MGGFDILYTLYVKIRLNWIISGTVAKIRWPLIYTFLFAVQDLFIS